MKKSKLLFLVFLFPFIVTAQEYYFPPLLGNDWEIISPTEAGFCTDDLDSLSTFLEENNTKAFIILKDGKIAFEEYYNGFGQDSVWYWASAAKTLTGYLVGVAQEEGLLDLDDKTSDYLGTGWTSASSEKEDLITIRHQLSMATGLDDGVPDPNCLDASCLQYLSDAGDRWSYHNAAYRLLQDVVENTSGQTFQNYTLQKMMLKTGLTGIWSNYVFYSKPRSMARFGSLILNQGNWNGTTVLADQNFQTEMISTSQNLNQSYGYLWWLNGKGSYMLPQSQIIFNTNLIPNAPDEMYAALGKNDQKLYLIPSQKVAIIRMGEAPGNSIFALSSFDNELWGILKNIICNETSATKDISDEQVKIFPNPTSNELFFEKKEGDEMDEIRIFNTLGQLVKSEKINSNQINISELLKGTYFIQFLDEIRNPIAMKNFFKL
jgi:CubicO group peptidase (beta-lactamase class C family)